jgi:hypothetical protein
MRTGDTLVRSGPSPCPKTIGSDDDEQDQQHANADEHPVSTLDAPRQRPALRDSG